VRVMVCLALLLGALVVKCYFDASAERLRREHLRLTSRPASPFSAHWYLGADNQSHLLPGERDPYAEEDDDLLARGEAVASTLPSVPSHGATRPVGSGGVMPTSGWRAE